MADTVTTRQDLPEWARSFGFGGLDTLGRLIFHDPTDGGDFWRKNAKGSDVFDMSGGLKKGGTPFNAELPSGYNYDAIMNDRQMPLAPLPEWYNDAEIAARSYAQSQMESAVPLRNAADQWLIDSIGGGDPNQADTPRDFASMYNTFLTAGPLAGASRAGMLDALTGNSQEYSKQRLLDSMYGKTSKSAENSLAGLIGPQSDIATDAATWSYAGPNAGAARARSYDTIQGKFLSPESNPYLKSNVDASLKAIADAYQYGTAPETMGQFARAGSYGGSAHQQTMKMKQFDLGRTLSDAANQMYGENFARERGAQESAINAERGLSASALEAERGRQYGAAENAMSRAQQAALDEASGYRSLLDSQMSRGAAASDSELNRNAQIMAMFPELMQSRYYDSDAARALYGEKRQLTDARNQGNYQNALTMYQLPMNLINILGSGLASFTGGGGVTTQTTTNPNAISPVAAGLGGTTVGLSALSALGGPSGLGFWGGAPPQGQ